ncbi:MAG: DNA-directed RNA polymerase subunit alpha, partial [Patescibacteria group bacterium]
MENNILLPEKFQIVEDKNTPYALDLVMEPFQSGYGLTVGNALRRILLSSLEGSSVFAIKIKGVKHEFDTLAGIKEDMIEVIINTKN